MEGGLVVMLVVMRVRTKDGLVTPVTRSVGLTCACDLKRVRRPHVLNETNKNHSWLATNKTLHYHQGSVCSDYHERLFPQPLPGSALSPGRGQPSNRDSIALSNHITRFALKPLLML